MKVLWTAIAVVVSVFISLTASADSGESAESAWRLAKDKEGIQVFKRDVEGYSINEFQGVATIKTTVAELVDLYTDTARCVDWVPECKSSKLLDRVSDSELTVYTEINNPWPFKNRDYILSLKLAPHPQNPAGVRITYSDVKDEMPKNKCCVRMEMMRGFWDFVPAGNGGVEVTYRYHFHPGGKLPGSVINSALPDMLFESLENMRNLLESTERTAGLATQ